MHADFWINMLAEKRGIGWHLSGVPKASKGKPARMRNAIAIRVKFDVPDAYFDEPTIVVKAEIPKRSNEPTVDLSMQASIIEALEKELGVKVYLSVDEPGEKGEGDE